MGGSSTPVAIPWDTFDSFNALGVKPGGGYRPGDPAAANHALEGSAGPSPLDRLTPLWHPDNPLFWFGGLLLVTFGLVAASTQIRLGPVRASVGAGNT